MSLSTNANAPTTEQDNRFTTYPVALGVISIVFFMWGFLTCLNDILIPHLKTVFELNYTKAMLIQFTFFGAYFIMSIPGGKLVSALGYKKGIITGLIIASIGAFGFWPAAISTNYYVFLFALFILATGITILQVGANPYVTLLGPEKTGSSRINLAQALNSLGTTVAPALGGVLILAAASYSLPADIKTAPETTQLVQTLNTKSTSEIKPVIEQTPPASVAYALKNIPPFIYNKLPNDLLLEQMQRLSPKLLDTTLESLPAERKLYVLSAMPQDTLEQLQPATLVSALDGFVTMKLDPAQTTEFQTLKSHLTDTTQQKIQSYRNGQAKSVQVPYAILGCVLLLLAGFVALFKLPSRRDNEPKSETHYTMSDVLKYPHVVFGALGIFCYVGAEVSVGSFMVNYLTMPEIGRMTEITATHYVSYFWGGAMIGRLIGSALMVKISPRKLLACCAVVNIILLITTMMSTGNMAVYSVVSIGLFNSIMFPTIFALGIAELGPLTEQGSSLIIMAIVGGAVIPFIQGMIADSIGLHHAFLLPLVCYVFILFYGVKGSVPKKVVA